MSDSCVRLLVELSQVRAARSVRHQPARRVGGAASGRRATAAFRTTTAWRNSTTRLYSTAGANGSKCGSSARQLAPTHTTLGAMRTHIHLWQGEDGQRCVAT